MCNSQKKTSAGTASVNSNILWWILCSAVILITFSTRFYKVTEPDHICWDETHFGKMGSWYINRTFFFDVHPPLGKMLIGLSGYLSGYDGKFPFEKPGDKYNETRYQGMRYFCTTLGSLIMPMGFDIIYDLTKSYQASLISAAYLIFDVGLLTLNQYILLDPILLFFMMGSVWGMVKISKATAKGLSYTLHWWTWLFITVAPVSFQTLHLLVAGSIGFVQMFRLNLIIFNWPRKSHPFFVPFQLIFVWLYLGIKNAFDVNFLADYSGTMLSCTISVKFVGLFVVVLVGLHTACELWLILGDLHHPITEPLKQVACRAVSLILWPVLLYTVFFYIHLRVLNRSGNGDGFYSSAFQSRLVGNSLYNTSMPRDVAFGAIVTLKNHKTGGGYLHSHFHLYPKGFGAKQQQVTTYTHKDENNKWIVKPYNKKTTEIDGLQLLRHGDLLRLEHLTTRRNLHSHNERAPMTKKNLQVTGYGEAGMGDANDVWRVFIIGGKVNDTVHTVTSKLKFVHQLENCALTSSGKQLPKWGFEQQEVSCNLNIRDKTAVWNIEDNKHKLLPNVNFSVYAPGFFSRFFESHAVMLQGNAGLKPKEGEVTSRPWQWPINYRGQFFSGTSYRVYLLGNPVIWWSNLIFLVLFICIFLFNSIVERRRAGQVTKGKISTNKNANRCAVPTNSFTMTNSMSLKAAAWMFIGWFLHYLPFWGMGRVLYFHHYFPALIFNSMLTGVMFDYIIGRLPKWMQHTLLGVYLSAISYSFILFAPLAYGMNGPMANEPNSTMNGLKWLSSWEF